MVSISRETFGLCQGPFFKMVFTVEGCHEDGVYISTLNKEEVEKRFYSILERASKKIFSQEYYDDTYIKKNKASDISEAFNLQYYNLSKEYCTFSRLRF